VSDTAGAGLLIRGTHPYVFRSGEWARLVGTVDDPGTGRRCYSVRFDDGATDWWPVGDEAAGYEFCDPAGMVDELDDYLREQMGDPGFREAYEAAQRRHRRAFPGPLAVDGRAYQRRLAARRKRRRR
jgi:hypothetical protein